MESRTEKIQKRKREIRKQILGIPKVLFILIVSLLLYMLTFKLWGIRLNETVYFELFETIVRINIMAVGIFMAIGYFNLRFFITLVKSFLKILFTVWVVVIVQFSSMGQVEQNVWIILSVFFFVYLEVLLEINDCLFQVKENFELPKLKFITSTFIKENSLALSIMCLAVINAVMSFFIIDLLNAIKVV